MKLYQIYKSKFETLHMLKPFFIRLIPCGCRLRFDVYLCPLVQVNRVKSLNRMEEMENRDSFLRPLNLKITRSSFIRKHQLE